MKKRQLHAEHPALRREPTGAARPEGVNVTSESRHASYPGAADSRGQGAPDAHRGRARQRRAGECHARRRLSWPAGAPLQGMGVGSRRGHATLCLHTRWCARLTCTALREAPEASHASRGSRQSACGLDALLHRRNMAGSTARCFRLTLSTSTSPATAGFAPSVSRQWPVSACSSATPARLQLRAPAVAFSPAWVGELAGQSVGCLPCRYWQRPAVSVLQGVAAPAACPICASPLICGCSCMLRQSANAYTC